MELDNGLLSLYIPQYFRDNNNDFSCSKLLYLRADKTHGCIRRIPVPAGKIKGKNVLKQSFNIKLNEIDIINIINDNTFNLHNSLLNNDNRYMKVILKSKLTGVARLLISADYRGF